MTSNIRAGIYGTDQIHTVLVFSFFFFPLKGSSDDVIQEHLFVMSAGKDYPIGCKVS